MRTPGRNVGSILLLVFVFDTGVIACQAPTAVGAPSPQTVTGGAVVPPGVWGGKGIRLTVTATGATVVYDCAVGTIDEPLRFDRAGSFVLRGTHSFGRGGPSREGDLPPKQHTARYEGRMDGETMRLTVFLPELNREVGKFVLEFGQRQLLELCV